MKTVATIRPARSAGVAMVLLGFFILFTAVPFTVFVASNFHVGVFYVVVFLPAAIGVGSIIAGILHATGVVKFGHAIEAETSESRKTSEDRFNELERLKRRDMVTPEEYAAKRQEILKDL